MSTGGRKNPAILASANNETPLVKELIELRRRNAARDASATASFYGFAETPTRTTMGLSHLRDGKSVILPSLLCERQLDIA